MKKTSQHQRRTLQLRKETIARLSDPQLKDAAGGKQVVPLVTGMSVCDVCSPIFI